MEKSVEEMEEESGKASDYPAIVMLDKETGNKYMRLVPCKGFGDANEAKWVIKDMHAELKAWGRSGGQQNKLLIETDGENPRVADREALAKEHGGLITPEQPPKGEHAANGKVEEAGRTI